MNIKFFKTKKNFKKKTSQINPDIYWNFIVYTTFVLILASFAFGFYLFIKTNEESPLAEGSTTGQIGLVKKVRIDKVLEYFAERKAKSLDILNSTSPVVDPSL